LPEGRKSSPPHGNSSPTDDRCSPIGGEGLLVDGKRSPIGVQGSLITGDRSPNQDKCSAIDRKRSPIQSELSPSDGRHSPTQGNRSPSEREISSPQRRRYSTESNFYDARLKLSLLVKKSQTEEVLCPQKSTAPLNTESNSFTDRCSANEKVLYNRLNLENVVDIVLENFVNTPEVQPQYMPTIITKDIDIMRQDSSLLLGLYLKDHDSVNVKMDRKYLESCTPNSSSICDPTSKPKPLNESAWHSYNSINRLSPSHNHRTSPIPIDVSSTTSKNLLSKDGDEVSSAPVHQQTQHIKDHSPHGDNGVSCDEHVSPVSSGSQSPRNVIARSGDATSRDPRKRSGQASDITGRDPHSSRNSQDPRNRYSTQNANINRDPRAKPSNGQNASSHNQPGWSSAQFNTPHTWNPPHRSTGGSQARPHNFRAEAALAPASGPPSMWPARGPSQASGPPSMWPAQGSRTAGRRVAPYPHMSRGVPGRAPVMN